MCATYDKNYLKSHNYLVLANQIAISVTISEQLCNRATKFEAKLCYERWSYARWPSLFHLRIFRADFGFAIMKIMTNVVRNSMVMQLSWLLCYSSKNKSPQNMHILLAKLQYYLFTIFQDQEMVISSAKVEEVLVSHGQNVHCSERRNRTKITTSSCHSVRWKERRSQRSDRASSQAMAR